MALGTAALVLAGKTAARGPSRRGFGPSPAVIGGIGGSVAFGFLDSALDLLGDLADPFLPGGAGSELRATAFGGDIARQNMARKAAGLPPIPTRRRRRRVALTAGDLSIMAFIATTISKKAAEAFVLQRVRRS